MYSGETAPSGAEGALHMKLSGKRTGYGRNSGKPNGTEEAIPAKREESFRFTNGGALITGAPPFFSVLCAGNQKRKDFCMEKKTPLYETHVQSGGKIVPFAGYLLPVQYSSITAEHMAVRTQAGLFDVSHMGEITLEGEDALATVQQLVTNNCDGMYDGQVRYSPMCNPNGGVIDDLLVYRRSENSYLLVVNAANREKDAAWIESHLIGGTRFNDISDSVAQIALQGPKSHEILTQIADDEQLPKKYYSFREHVSVAGIDCLVSKTGYTGESGYELYTANENAAKLWDALIGVGESFGLIPCGLGARDTLRLEASMPLYGHEMNDEISPLETGLGFFVKLDKDDFIGKSAILERGEPKIKRVGLELTGRGIARDGDAVFSGGVRVGTVSSGTMCPYLKKAVAMALVQTDSLNIGDEAEIEVRGRRIAAKVIPLPFYKKA